MYGSAGENSKEATNEYIAMLDLDEDGIITEEELTSMAFVNDESDIDDLALVNAMKTFYLSQPANEKAW